VRYEIDLMRRMVHLFWDSEEKDWLESTEIDFAIRDLLDEVRDRVETYDNEEG